MHYSTEFCKITPREKRLARFIFTNYINNGSSDGVGKFWADITKRQEQNKDKKNKSLEKELEYAMRSL